VRTEHLAKRITQGRKLASLSQAELGSKIQLDSTAVSKIEAGKRQVSALELMQIAEVIGKPVAWFANADSQTVLSHRNEAGSDLQARIDDAASTRSEEVRLLHSLGTLSKRDWQPLNTNKGVEELAGDIRRLLDVGTGPLIGLANAAENLGLFAFVEDFGPGVEACYCPVERGLGVAIVNGAIPPGRRRLNLAHELVHHVLQDRYEITWTESGIAAEQRIQAIAGELLAPKAELLTEFLRQQQNGRTKVEALNVLAFYFRISLSAVVHQLSYLSADILKDTIVSNLGRVERNELGISRFEDELPIGLSPQSFERAIASAVRKHLISPSRADEMLPGESFRGSASTTPVASLIGGIRDL
jgi:Zn-dependent peptidase ImmA (M78 family)/DNA-binding XRE family transcriptional regulator